LRRGFPQPGLTPFLCFMFDGRKPPVPRTRSMPRWPGMVTEAGPTIGYAEAIRFDDVPRLMARSNRFFVFSTLPYGGLSFTLSVVTSACTPTHHRRSLPGVHHPSATANNRPAQPITHYRSSTASVGTRPINYSGGATLLVVGSASIFSNSMMMSTWHQYAKSFGRSITTFPDQYGLSEFIFFQHTNQIGRKNWHAARCPLHPAMPRLPAAVPGMEAYFGSFVVIEAHSGHRHEQVVRREPRSGLLYGY
jgi:hypothetical protein